MKDDTCYNCKYIREDIITNRCIKKDTLIAFPEKTYCIFYRRRLNERNRDV